VFFAGKRKKEKGGGLGGGKKGGGEGGERPFPHRADIMSFLGLFRRGKGRKRKITLRGKGRKGQTPPAKFFLLLFIHNLLRLARRGREEKEGRKKKDEGEREKERSYS